MQIKKLEENMTYKKTTTTHEFDINGKKVKVYSHYFYDDISGDYDNDEVIDEQDKEKLTEDELETLEVYLSECLDLKVDEVYEAE